MVEVARQAATAWTAGRVNRGRAGRPSIAIGSGATGSARLSPATINRRLCVLKAAAKHAWKQGWIDENLSGRITLLPEHNKREVYLSSPQLRKLADAAPDSTIKAAILIAAYSGLRSSELLAITPSCLHGESLSVQRSKSGKPRNIPVVPLLRPYLSALPLGLSYDQLYKGFCKAREAAGMPHVRFHDLRHSCASMLINAGVDLYTVDKAAFYRGMYGCLDTSGAYRFSDSRTSGHRIGRLRGKRLGYENELVRRALHPGRPAAPASQGVRAVPVLHALSTHPAAMA